MAKNKLGSSRFFRRKKIRKDELLNLDIEFVSLVSRPANGKSAVVKSADGKQYKAKGTAKITKVQKDGTQGRIYATVYEPDVKDAHGEFATKAEIQKACDNFSEKGRMRNVDVDHNLVKDGDFYVSENSILKSADPVNYPDTKVGSWVQVIKCKDLNSETWKRVEKGEIKGVSMYGDADVIDDNAATIATLQKSVDKLKTIIEKSEDGGSSTLKAEIKALETEIAELKGSDNDDNVQRSINKLEKSFDKLLTSMNKVISKSLNDDPGGDDMGDTTVIGPSGEKLVIKASRKTVRKALADLTFGEKMDVFSPTDFQLFLDAIISYGADESLQDISILPIHKDGKVDLGLLQDIIMHNEADGALDEQLVATGDKTMVPQVLLSHVALKRETVEFYKDNYGEDAYLAYIDESISQGIRNALGTLLFSGDRTSGELELKAINGVVTRAKAAGDITVIKVDDATEPDFKTIFKTALKGFTKKMLRKKKNFVMFCSDYMLLDIQSFYADRKTAAGDGFLLKDDKVFFNGIPVKPRFMDDDILVVGLSRAIIIGYITDVEMDKGKKLGEWKIHWYTRSKWDIGYLAGFVKFFKLEAPATATDVKITGTVKVGEELTGNYTFNDINDDVEGETSLRWLICATKAGTYAAIAGATSATYTPVADDATKYIKFEVTPRSATGTLDGEAVLSSRTNAVQASA